MAEVDLTPLEGLVARSGGQVERIEPMPGGASTRRYYRVVLRGGGSAVGMYVPEGHKPEEIDHGHRAARWPFLEVRDLLESRGVRVPRLLGDDSEHGWLLLEDLGDDTLANYLVKNPGERLALYVRAVADLARAQAHLASLPEVSIVRARAFDEKLLLWEVEHFREWALEARGVTLGSEDRAAFDAVAERLARRIASWPRSFVHRDYQSRNLMVVGGELVWVDFQDALMGPRVYDLVALLNDSYQEFDRAFVEARLDEYAAHVGGGRGEREALGLEFDLVTVQRKLKDAGRFVFIDRVKNNPSFLRFVEPTIRKARASIERLASAGDADMVRLSLLLRRASRTDLR